MTEPGNANRGGQKGGVGKGRTPLILQCGFGCATSRVKNCTDLWQKFYTSFAYKGPCDFDINSYDEFIRASRHSMNATDKVQPTVFSSCSSNRLM